MNKGALLFAFNIPKFNYYSMAVATAKRINHFLDLPVTIVTDQESLLDPWNKSDYVFDNTIISTPDKSNKRGTFGMWVNKGRYQAFEYSPYQETLLLDVDYQINSSKLLTTFNLPTDFCCHNRTNYLMYPTAGQDSLGGYTFDTVWATAVMFKKTNRTEQIFECLKLVQNNYAYYANIHGFLSTTFRNDFALTIALRIVNGHTFDNSDYIPWSLTHVGAKTFIYKNNDDPFNTEYTILYDHWNKGKIRKEYIIIKDHDFHVMDKPLFWSLIKDG